MVADAVGGAIRRKVIANRQLVPRLMLTKVLICRTEWYLEHGRKSDSLVPSC